MNPVNLTKTVGPAAVAGGAIASTIGAPVIMGAVLAGGLCCALGVLVGRAKKVSVEGAHQDKRAKIDIEL